MTNSTLEPMHPVTDWNSEDILETFISGMNPAQARAVGLTEGPLLILAGAGSGKTRVLTHRIAYILASKKARRNQIMAVTFTNKAAKEMAERIAHLCGQGRFPDLGTFHSVCARWLRREAEALELNAQFAIYATAEQLVVMKETIKDMGLDDKKFTPRGMLSMVSGWKNQMVTVDEVRRRASNAFERHLAQIYELYQRKLKQNQALDFDDILLKTVEMLQNHADIRERYQERIRYVMVDEYQDVNAVQYELLRLLAARHRNLCAVGDDDQSIYAFRGADVSILLRFEKDFQDAQVVKLEQNYRSTQVILDAANAVVAHNQARKSKRLFTERLGGEKLHLFQAADGRDEGRFITREIKRLLPNRTGYKDFVLLYRTNSQSRLLEEAMIQASIPYKIVGGLRFFERKEIKDVLSYLAVLINPADSIALRRIINTPTRGIGATTMEKLLQAAAEREMPLWEVVCDPSRFDVAGKARASIEDFVAWMTELRAQVSGLKVTELVEKVLENSGYRKWLQEDDKVEAQVRLENLDELINVTSEYDRNAEDGSLDGFLAEVSLLSDQDTYAEDAQAVTLMTLHAAKGLEFPVVFLAGLEEETFPHVRSMEDPAQMEEERRLCYVGITRAKDHLFVTFAQSRELHGTRIARRPSRFLKEIPKNLTNMLIPERPSFQEPPAIGSGNWKGWGNQQPLSRSAPTKAPGSLSTAPASPQFKPGDQVTHSVFGAGTVDAVDKDVVTVTFEKGQKKLKQEFLKPATAGGGSGQLKVGDRLAHPRYGNGVVKYVDGSGVTTIFGNLTLLLPPVEAARMKL
ncbi:MAG: 3'-5' exonuclease [Vulcanimicrobiota bacterium]